jgi:cytochrome bd ubiquinol oxidase subunit II
MMVLWLLMLRAIGIEFRTHIDNPVWQGLFDVIFSVASILLAIFFGAALGNVIRGVPLSKDGYFFEALWTNFRVGPNPGILDWYTVLAGVVALVTLTVHGALYIALKTEGQLEQRSRMIALVLWPVQALLTVLSLIATVYVSPYALENYRSHAFSFVIPLLVVGSLILILYFARKADFKKSFLSSSAYIATMLVGAVYGLYPVILPATNPAYSLTIFNSAAGHHGLMVGLVWWSLGMVLSLGYFFFIYRMFRGKVQLEQGHGY